MKKFGSSWLALAAIVTGLGAASSAHAYWTFGSGSTVAADGTGVSITNIQGAYASNGGTLTGSGGVITSGTTYGINGFASSGTTWTTGTSAAGLTLYSGGLGMSSDSLGSSQPNHAIDNGPSTTLDANSYVNGLGKTESILLSFSSSVVLSSVGIGYKFGDADISLFRYTGGSAPTLNGVGANLSNMNTAGWQLVGNYGDLAQDTSAPFSTVNSGALGSSWWLISAYNSSYGSATTGTVNQGNDFFKLFAVEGTKCTSTANGVCGPTTTQHGAPEPGSLALAGMAIAGVFASRRKVVAQLKAA